MTCAEAADLIEPYLDDELEPGARAEVHEHLASCADCGESLARLRDLRTDIQTHAPRYTAPAHLQSAIQDSLRRRSFPWQWAAIAAGVLLAISAAWNVTLLRSHDPVAEAVLSSHVRSLIGTHLLDVPSSDQHTVKPWFNGRLPFAPDVQDFVGQGFPLIGGRIEYFAERPVAALVYHRRRHVINLFTWPGEGGSGESARNGFTLVHWTKNGMSYWAVSDVSADDLHQFVALYGR